VPSKTEPLPVDGIALARSGNRENWRRASTHPPVVPTGHIRPRLDVAMFVYI